MVPLNQFIAAILCNLGTYSFGLSIGWLSPSVPQLRSPEAPVGEVTLEQTSWLAGIPFLSATFGTFLVAYIAENYGRKKCALYAGIPIFINNLMVILAKSIWTILVGRLILGFGLAAVICNVQNYVGEIANPNVRGILGSFFMLLYALGITTSYVVGGYYSYKAAAALGLIVSVVYVILFYFVPETPAYLITTGKKSEAIDAIAWFNREKVDSLKVKSEMDRFQSILNYDRLSAFQAARLLIVSKPLRNGFLICLGMLMIQAFVGMLAVHSYSVTIFMQGGGEKLGAKNASIVYGSIQIIGALSTTWLVERLGRKVLMVGSCVGVFVCMMTMAIFFHLKSNQVNLSQIEWVPVVSLSLCAYVYMVGIGAIPFILISDLLSTEVRSMASMISIQVLCFASFFILKFYGPISDAYGMHVLFYFFGVNALLGGILALWILSETKGKTAQEIFDTNYRFKKTLTVNTLCKDGYVVNI